MDSLYHQTNKLIHDLQNGLSRVERSSNETFQEAEAQVQGQMDQILSNCDRLDVLVNKEPPTRRATAKLRVDQLKYDCQHMQAALRTIQHKRYQKAEEERERDALLARRFTTNDADTSIMIDQALQQNQSLQGANRGMDELLHSGSTILSNIRDQRGTLKGAHKKMLDLANTLGLSNTVMRLIERRTDQDKLILYGGMLLMCVFMFLVWKYLT